MMKFYVLRNPRHGEAREITDFIGRDVIVGDAPTCPRCGGFVGMLRWEPPFRVELEFWGEGHGDVAFGAGNEILVSGRFRDLFTENRLVGLSGFHPVEVVAVKPKRMRQGMPDYYVGRVERSRTLVDDAASGFEYDGKWTCAECRVGKVLKRAARVVVVEDSWSGEDVFFARGLPGTIITSQRFKDFAEANALKNVLLIEASRYSFDFYRWESKQV